MTYNMMRTLNPTHSLARWSGYWRGQSW